MANDRSSGKKQETKFEKDRWKFMIGTKVYKVFSGTTRKNETSGHIENRPGFYLRFEEEFEKGPISCDIEKQVNDWINNMVSGGRLNGEGTIEKERKAMLNRALNYIHNHPDFKYGMIVPYVPPQERHKNLLAEQLGKIGYDIPPEELEKFKRGLPDGDDAGDQERSPGQDIPDGSGDS